MPDPVAPPAEPVTPPVTPPAAWHSSFDAETVGYLKNRGLDTKTPEEAVLDLSKAHREAQKFIGAPEDQLIRLPKDANDPAWKNVWSRLGAAADAKGYDFSDIKRADGSDLDPKFSDSLKAAAAARNLPVQMAKDVVRDLVKIQDETRAEEAAKSAQTLAQELDALQKNWGANFNVNKIVADNAAAKLGVTVEQIAALKTMVGGAKVMEMFRNIGTKIGEDSFVRDPSGQSSGAMTVEQAQAKLTALKADKEWAGKLMNKNVLVLQEFDNLMGIVSGVSGR